MTTGHTSDDSLQAKMDGFKLTIEKAMKFKKVMLGKGLTKAKTKCFRCDGHIWGKLYPNRRDKTGYHLHMSCDGTCGTTLME